MKVKNKKLEWYALRHDFNNNKIVKYNVFSDTYKEDLYKKYRAKKITTKAELKEDIKRYCMYHYWSKSECEIAMGGLHCKSVDEMEKVDIWNQLEINLDHIVDYVNTYLDINLV